MLYDLLDAYLGHWWVAEKLSHILGNLGPFHFLIWKITFGCHSRFCVVRSLNGLLSEEKQSDHLHGVVGPKEARGCSSVAEHGCLVRSCSYRWGLGRPQFHFWLWMKCDSVVNNKANWYTWENCLGRTAAVVYQLFFYIKNNNAKYNIISDYFIKKPKINYLTWEQLMLKCTLSPIFSLCISLIYTWEVISQLPFNTCTPFVNLFVEFCWNCLL